ncbi:hypothetical protein H1R20_g5931, partial [Candolleomyces eurysporus]
MKPRDYCCCAIPTVNAGIYITLIEQFVIGILVGVLSIATPSIVGAATPSFARWILAIICFVVSAVQVLGFIGVSREKPTLYRRYVTIHALVALAAFAVAAAWLILSATKHNDARQRCIDDFFNGDGETSQGDTLCNIFAWVDVGIMGGLWVILAILHFYLMIVVKSYGAGQREDHREYDRLYDPSQPLSKNNIPMADRSDPWDARPSEEKPRHVDNRYTRNYTHVRQNSSVSATDVLSEPYQQPANGYRDYTPYQSYSDNVAQPTYAYTQREAPTPYDGSYAGQQDSKLDRPMRTQGHPGES